MRLVNVSDSIRPWQIKCRAFEQRGFSSECRFRKVSSMLPGGICIFPWSTCPSRCRLVLAGFLPYWLMRNRVPCKSICIGIWRLLPVITRLPLATLRWTASSRQKSGLRSSSLGSYRRPYFGFSSSVKGVSCCKSFGKWKRYFIFNHAGGSGFSSPNGLWIIHLMNNSLSSGTS